jgi:hypothetical protein
MKLLATLLLVAATVSAMDEDTAWRLYNEQRGTKVLFRGQLVDRASLTCLTGFVTTTRSRLRDGERMLTGGILNLAMRKPDATGADTMVLRPSLWQRTNEQVLLFGYEPPEGPGVLVRVYGLEVRRVSGIRVFQIATEPSFEEWKRLASR